MKTLTPALLMKLTNTTSRRCPNCRSRKTKRIGEFAVCLKCKEPFHHSSKDEAVSEDSADYGVEFESDEINESIGGTSN